MTRQWLILLGLITMGTVVYLLTRRPEETRIEALRRLLEER